MSTDTYATRICGWFRPHPRHLWVYHGVTYECPGQTP